MLDREYRDRYAEQLRHFTAGVLRVDEYEKRTDDLLFDTYEPAVQAIWDGVWRLYDDFRTDRLRDEWALDADTRKRIARCILFLYSDAEYKWPEYEGHCGVDCLVGGAFALLNVATVGLLRPLWDRLSLPYQMRRHEEHQRWMRRFGDIECWPFLRREEFESALLSPRFFTGAISAS